MYLTSTNNHYAIDIETDGLRDDLTRIWCICIEHIHSNAIWSFTELADFLGWLNEHPNAVFIAHNGIGFDIPVLNSLAGAKVGISRVVDTFLLSMLYSPSLAGGHSLESWGQRLKLEKKEYDGFDTYTPEMLEYCRRDTSLCKRLYQRLTARMRDVGFSEQSARIEHLSWNIIQNKQRRRGFPFRRIDAELLYAEIRQRQEELKDEIYKLWPPQFACVKHFAKSHKANGEPTKDYLRHLEQYPELRCTDDGGYDAFDFVEFNLGSPSQRVEKLLELGWKPVKFTKKTPKGGGGNPQVDEESLLKFAEETGSSEVRALAGWIVAASRGNMVRDWLNNYNEKTEAIHGQLWLANTLRYRHDHPNSANIPAVRKSGDGEVLRGQAGSWAYECRDLWWCGDDGYSLVGVDAKGIQLRILAHYLDDPSFTENILQADPHAANQKAWGFAEGKPGRALAKTIVYATLMGAGDNRISVEAKIPLDDAKAAKKIFFDKVPGLPGLIKRLKGELNKTGRITLCDGSRIMVPSDHMVIPYLLQGDESRIMRQTAILVDEGVRRAKIEAWKVGDIHDEWQNVVHNDCVGQFRDICSRAFPDTGRIFKYRVPLESDCNVGRSWAETH